MDLSDVADTLGPTYSSFHLFKKIVNMSSPYIYRRDFTYQGAHLGI